MDIITLVGEQNNQIKICHKLLTDAGFCVHLDTAWDTPFLKKHQILC